VPAPEPTVLARQLARTETLARPTALDAFKLARRRFKAGERIEMQLLAERLGINRVTLHRWVGSRDELLCEVLWSLAEPTLANARAAARTRGGARVADTLERFMKDVLATDYMRQFLEREPEIALRILTTKRTAFQARLVAFMHDVIAEETDAGALDPPLPIDDLAYLVVRIAESFFYTDIIARGQPHPTKARQAIAALLR
jgi:AcrR family transcriptional regulator